MQNFAFILFAIAIIIIAAYALFYYGAPHGITFINPFGYSTSTAPAQQAPAKNTRNNNYVQPVYNNPVNKTPTPTIDPSRIPSGFSIKDISPYFGKISMSVSPGYSGSYSQISIRDNMNSSEGTVKITGWLLKGNRGNQYIPKAVGVYLPSGFVSESDIYFKNGDTLTIYSTYGALGVNLRMNKCVGYLANTVKFNPPVYPSCPSLNRSEISSFTGQCQSYVLSLGGCQSPAPNPPIPFNDSACADFLSKLNYAGCFAKHQNDYDFLGNQWYAWSGSQFLDYQHDRLLLFDKQGLLVAEYAY